VIGPIYSPADHASLPDASAPALPRVGVVIVNFNGSGCVGQCLTALVAAWRRHPQGLLGPMVGLDEDPERTRTVGTSVYWWRDHGGRGAG